MKKSVENAFNKWKAVLDQINYTNYTFEDFNLYFNLENKVKLKNVYDPQYHKQKYFMLDFELIRKKHLDFLKNKRGSPYDPINVSKKLNISISDAEKIVEERKNKTAGTLENFIKRHGEERGKKLFQEFKEKSKSSLVNFIKRYGEKEGINRWNNYLETRDSNSLEYFVKKYKDQEIGEMEYQKHIANMKGRGSLEYYIKRFGEENGEEKYKELCRKKGYKSTLAFYTEEYGEEGLIRYKELNSKKTYHWTLEFFIEKYGEIEGKKRYLDSIKDKTQTLENFIKRHGEERGKELFQEYVEKQKYAQSLEYYINNYENGETLYAERYKKVYTNNKTGSSVSKQSKVVFERLEKVLDRSLEYGSRKKEKCLQQGGKNYFYDCFDEKTNTLFEYNGSYYHPNPTLVESERKKWFHPLTKESYHQVQIRDENKLFVARSQGYNIIVIWDNEVKSKQKLEKKILEILEELNENKIY